MTIRRRPCAPHPIEQEVGEQERREMVERERQLEPVLGDMAVRPEPADVVDEDVESRVALQQLGRRAGAPAPATRGRPRRRRPRRCRPCAEIVGGGESRAGSRPTMATRAPRAASPSGRGLPDPPGAAGDHGVPAGRGAVTRSCSPPPRRSVRRTTARTLRTRLPASLVADQGRCKLSPERAFATSSDEARRSAPASPREETGALQHQRLATRGSTAGSRPSRRTTRAQRPTRSPGSPGTGRDRRRC